MKIVVDLIGGEHPPEVLVRGCIETVIEEDIQLVLVCKREFCLKELEKYSFDKSKIELVDCSESIGMDEIPLRAVKEKPNSSIMVATRLLKEEKADALFSPGNTGAIIASSLLNIGKIKNVKKLAIGVMFPHRTGNTLLLDCGANLECNEKHLKEFAYLGLLYYSKIFNNDNPKIGLLNVGSEAYKGNKIALKANKLLASSGLNFIGNVEGTNIFDGSVDVAVCDGFTGNILLKSSESLAKELIAFFSEMLKEKVYNHISDDIKKENFKSIKDLLDFKSYGGAPLLGLSKTVVIGHGISNDRAIKNGIKLASSLVKANLVGHIENYFANKK